MRYILLSTISISCLVICFAPAATLADSVGPGEVHGTWALAGSPWLIDGEIEVPVGQTLVIEPGVEVRARGWYGLSVRGQLLAIGAAGDTIRFSADDPYEGWRGIRFYDTTTQSQPLSEVRYCRIQNGRVSGSCPDNCGGAIYCGSSDPLIANNLITMNDSVQGMGNWGGGGIYCDFASPTIQDNVIIGNNSGGDGGGICCYWSSPEIIGNIIMDNNATRGDGIACFLYSSPTISGNTISNNHGRAVYLSGGTPTLVNNVLDNNSGGAVECYNSSPDIIGCLISNNSGGSGGGIYLEGSSPRIINCTLADNNASSGGGLGVSFLYAGVFVYSYPVVTNTIFWGNTASTGSQIYSSAGNMTTVNYCDVQDMAGAGNDGPLTELDGCVDGPPMFQTLQGQPYCLNIGSACHNTGTPDPAGLDLPPYDLAGNERIMEARVDMGALEYHEYVPVPQASVPGTAISNVFPNPFNPATRIEYSLAGDGPIDLAIYDVAGRRVRSLLVGGGQQGNHELSWDGCDDDGHALPAGVYLVRLWSGGQLARRSVTLLK